MGDIFAGLAGGGIFMAAKKLTGLFDKIKETIDNLFGKKGGGEHLTGLLLIALAQQTGDAGVDAYAGAGGNGGNGVGHGACLLIANNNTLNIKVA